MTLKELEKRIQALEEKEKRLDALEEIENRLKAIEDLEEIKKLHRDYIFWLSNHQWDDMVDCFAEDAVAEIGKHGEQKGKNAIRASFDSDISKVASYQKGGQILIQPVITVDGDSARGYWSWYRLNTEFRSPSGQSVQLFGPEMQAKYDCEYKKEKGKWKFSRMELTRPWPEQTDRKSMR
ncbi:nuclear transport factor 2 family protein [Thermodesulfobacteriota bacterium]